MTTQTIPGSTITTWADRLQVPVDRIRRSPTPGLATEDDFLQLTDGLGGRPCELIDGTIVEKPVGMRESFFAMAIVGYLFEYLKSRNTGIVSGPDGGVRMLQGNVLMPDVCYFPWDSLPNGEPESGAIWETPPALAVEVLSPSNTPAEIARKIDQLFALGTLLIWVFDPRDQTTVVYTSPDQSVELDASDTLTGEPVLPGFRLPLAELFGQFDRRRSK